MSEGAVPLDRSLGAEGNVLMARSKSTTEAVALSFQQLRRNNITLGEGGDRTEHRLQNRKAYFVAIRQSSQICVPMSIDTATMVADRWYAASVFVVDSANSNGAHWTC